MKIITRLLHEGIQGDPDRPEMAEMDARWEQAWQAYRAHLAEIHAKLPLQMQALSKITLHDGTVESVDRPSESVLILTVDAANNPWGPRGLFRICFTGVKLAEVADDLVGDDWLYEEVHLHPAARFDFYVMFSGSDFRVVADDVEFREIKADI